jgi:hypothetical protein
VIDSADLQQYFGKTRTAAAGNSAAAEAIAAAKKSPFG